MRTDKINIIIKKIIGNRSKKLLTMFLFPFRNNFILFNISKKAHNNCVNLNYWDEAENLGDMLAPIIVHYLLSLKGINPNKKIKEKKHLYSVGSILTAGIQDATVWGSGVLNATLTYRLCNRNLDIRAVRGPVTRAILKDYGYDVPEVYGDPAILLPEIFKPNTVEKKFKYGLVLHKDYEIDDEIKKEILSRNSICIINICTSDYQKFVNDICCVDVVISSSLHGIILAESYGIPAILLKPQKDFIKYLDYYYSTGRVYFPIAKTVEEAIDIPYSTPPSFNKLKADLIKSFPYDMYE